MSRKRQMIDAIKLGWPISLQNILVTLLGMIDVIMVSHIGDAAIGAVGLGNRVLFVVMVVIFGLSWGVGILSAQYYGAQQTHKIRRTIVIGFSISIVALLPIIIANYFFASDIIAFGSTDLKVIELGTTYLWLAAPSLIFVAVIQILENALRSVNQVKLPLLFSIVAIILNIVLNLWLINGGFGVPAMGVAGAALATTISRGVQAVVMVVALVKMNHFLAVRLTDFYQANDLKEWRKLIILIVPMMFSFGVWALGSFCYQLIFGRLGTNELAVISMLLPLEGMFLSLFFGIAAACSITIGQHLGAERNQQAWEVAKTFTFLSPLVAIVIGLIVVIFRDLILAPYEGVSPITLAMSHQIFLIIAGLAWLKVINLTLAMGVLRAGGDNRYCLITDTTCMWLISLPLTWLAAFYWHLDFKWVVLISYSEELAKGVMFGWRMRSKRWIRNLTH